MFFNLPYDLINVLTKKECSDSSLTFKPATGKMTRLCNTPAPAKEGGSGSAWLLTTVAKFQVILHGFLVDKLSGIKIYSLAMCCLSSKVKSGSSICWCLKKSRYNLTYYFNIFSETICVTFDNLPEETGRNCSCLHYSTQICFVWQKVNCHTGSLCL